MWGHGQSSLNLVLTAGEVGNLVRLLRTHIFKDEQLLHHDHRLGTLEVEAVVLELQCFSRHLV